MTQTLTVLSFIICLISGCIHCIRLYQRKIPATNAISWFLWSGIAIALFLSYRDMNASNIWPSISNMIFPIINACLCVVRWKEYGTHLAKEDWYCGILGIISLVMWACMKDAPELVQYANYVAIIADAFALIPMLRLVWQQPYAEIPLPWLLFAFAFLLALPTLNRPVEFIMPIYMILGSGSVGTILAVNRVKLNRSLSKPWYKGWM